MDLSTTLKKSLWLWLVLGSLIVGLLVLGLWQLTRKEAPAADDALVLRPGQGVGPVRFGMSPQEVEKLLGPPSQKKYQWQWHYPQRGLTIFFGPKGVKIITCYSSRAITDPEAHDFAGKTPEGIGIGSTENDIIQAYGPPKKRRESTGTVYLEYDQLAFTLFNNYTVSIMMTSEQKSQ
jgi:hypothetical protein